MTTKKDTQTTLPAAVHETFVSKIKEVLPKNVGLADEIAELLNISNDSAYRRIRGETSFALEEVYLICNKYKISMDDVFSNRGDTVTFAYTKLIAKADSFESYFNRLLGHLNAIYNADDRRIYYVAEETPIFYSFYSEKLAAFKLFYWLRSVLNAPEYQSQKFDWNCVPKSLIETAHNSYKIFQNVPTTEVWTTETILTGLKQVRFYYDSGVIEKSHALDILADTRKMIERVQENAERGKKNAGDAEETFVLYHCEILLGTNCIFVQAGASKYSYISFNTVNSLSTQNSEFCEETEHWINSLVRKSLKISGAAEKHRSRFFNKIFKYIDTYSEAVKNDE